MFSHFLLQPFPKLSLSLTRHLNTVDGEWNRQILSHSTESSNALSASSVTSSTAAAPRRRCRQERLPSNKAPATTGLEPPSTTSASSAYAMLPKPPCKLEVPEIKDKCRRYLVSRVGRRSRRRDSSAGFRYDAASYALNFDDGADDLFGLRLGVASAKNSNR